MPRFNVDFPADQCFETGFKEQINVGAGGGSKFHDKLLNRELPDQHPIEAITGLQEALDSKLPSSTKIPTKTSDLANDSGFIDKDVDNLTNYETETDITAKLGLKADKTELPTKVSELENDLDFATNQEVNDKINNIPKPIIDYNKLENRPSLNGIILEGDRVLTFTDVNALSSTTELKDLPQDETHRTVTDLEKQEWSAKSNFNGDYESLTNKPKIPTNVSELVNDSNYIDKAVADLTNYYLKTETYTQKQVLELVDKIPKFSIKVVEMLPVDNISTTTIYLVKTGLETDNLYTEYIYVEGKWEILGRQKLDLSNYVQNTRKINGKPLSADITLTASDVDALPNTTTIPTKTSELENNSDFTTKAYVDGMVGTIATELASLTTLGVK